METPVKGVVSTRLLEVLNGRPQVKRVAQAVPIAVEGAATGVVHRSPTNEEIDVLLREAVRAAAEILAPLGQSRDSEDTVEAVAVILRAFEVVRELEERRSGELILAGLRAGERIEMFHINIWHVVGSALHCVTFKGDIALTDPYSAQGASFVAFAGASMLMQSLSQYRDTILTVADVSLPVPSDLTSMVDEMEHAAYCDECADGVSHDDADE